MRLTCILLILLLHATVVCADLLIESTDGPVTAAEIAAFKEYMHGQQYRGDNNHNNMVYGNLGKAAEASGDIYEITHDRQILDEFIQRADMMLAGATTQKRGVFFGPASAN